MLQMVLLGDGKLLNLFEMRNTNIFLLNVAKAYIGKNIKAMLKK